MIKVTYKGSMGTDLQSVTLREFHSVKKLSGITKSQMLTALSNTLKRKMRSLYNT